jgi:hypothetical protein
VKVPHCFGEINTSIFWVEYTSNKKYAKRNLRQLTEKYNSKGWNLLLFAMMPKEEYTASIFRNENRMG